MEDVKTYKRNCPFCGKNIEYKDITDDGTDWMGHHYGDPRSYTEGYECECEKIPFKRMCLNCMYFNFNQCENTSMIEDIKEKLGEDSPLIVSDISLELKKDLVTNACKYWKLNTVLISKYFKE